MPTVVRHGEGYTIEDVTRDDGVFVSTTYKSYHLGQLYQTLTQWWTTRETHTTTYINGEATSPQVESW